MGQEKRGVSLAVASSTLANSTLARSLSRPVQPDSGPICPPALDPPPRASRPPTHPSPDPPRRTAQKFALFCTLPPPFSLSFLSLRRGNFGGVLKAGTLKCARGAVGLSCESAAVLGACPFRKPHRSGPHPSSPPTPLATTLRASPWAPTLRVQSTENHNWPK